MSNIMVRWYHGSSRVALPSVSLYWKQSRCHSFHRAMTSTAASTPPPGPVLTFLSPSPTHSRAAVHFLNNMFQLPRVGGPSESKAKVAGRDCLDELHFGSLSSSWDSVACACPTSGTILHFMSFSSDKTPLHPKNNHESINESRSPIHLIAIHGSDSGPTSLDRTAEEQYNDALLGCRQQLAKSIQKGQAFSGSTVISNLESHLRGVVIYVMCNILGRHANPSWILGKNQSTSPLLELTPSPSNTRTSKNDHESQNSNENTNESNTNTSKLRELALPFFPGVSSLQTKLSKSSLLRPLPGLYQCAAGLSGTRDTAKRKTTTNPGLIFRPLPAAQEDIRLSPPSLVFQCESLAEAQKLAEEKLGGKTYKIGWRGHGQLGSLIVSHPSIQGLDIRICEAAGSEWVLSSSFDEAQDSLLAGSLAELQSSHVISEGKSGGSKKAEGDPKSGNGDCWVEVRSNVRHPTGFLKQFTSPLLQKPVKTRVAKPPDIPYE